MRTLAIILITQSLILCGSSTTAQNIDYVSSILWSEANDVKVVGGNAYCAFTNGLVTLDVSDPSSPDFIGKIYLHGYGQSIGVSGDYAYVADQSLGLRTIDISDPANPVLKGTFDTQSRIEDISVVGNYVYMANLSDGFKIVDVSDAANPALIGGHDTQGPAMDVFVSGGFAYVAVLSYGLQIFNISDPANPAPIGGYDTPGETEGIFVAGNYAYVADRAYGLQIVNVSDPSNPALIGGIITPHGANDVFVTGGIAYITYEMYGLQIIDVTDPANPYLLGHYDNPDDAIIRHVSISGEYAYLASDGCDESQCLAGLEIINISNPSEPFLTAGYGKHSLNNVYVTTDTSGQYAFVADSDYILHIVDYWNPGNPVVVGGYNTQGVAQDIFVIGSLAYITTGDWGYASQASLQILDITDVSNPIAVGRYDTTGIFYNIYVSESYAVLAWYDYYSDYTRLFIMDINNPAEPVLAGVYNPIYPVDIFVSGNYCYVADYWFGLRIIDISNPSNPTLRGSYEAPGDYTYGVFVDDGYAYMTWTNGNPSESGLEILDVTNPSTPAFVGEYEMSGWRYSLVYVSGSYAYLSNSNVGLQVVDVSDPSEPIFGASCEQRGQSIFVEGEFIFLGSQSSLMLLRFDPETGISEISGLPEKFSLKQNYPNPFNASTIIEYDLPEASDVTIEIYDLLGRRVETLVDERKEAGHYNAVWNADGFSSGIYFYKVQYGNQVQSSKMILLK